MDFPTGLRSPRRSVRTALLLSITLLVLIILLSLGTLLHRAYVERENAEAASLAGARIEHLFLALNAFSFERGRVYALLSSREPIYQRDIEFIQRMRRQSAAAFAWLRRSIEEENRDFSLIEGQIQVDDQSVLTLRILADEALALPIGARDPKLQNLWLSTCDQLLEDFQRWVEDEIPPLRFTSSRLDNYTDMELCAFRLRTDYGLKNTLLIAALYRHSLGDPEFEKILMLEGASETDQDQLNRITSSRYGDLSLVPAVKSIEETCFGNGKVLQTEILKALRLGQRVPISIDEYKRMSEDELNSISDLVDTVIQRSREQSAAIVRGSDVKLLVNSLTAAIGLLVGILALSTLFRRLFRPLAAIKRSLLTTSLFFFGRSQFLDPRQDEMLQLNALAEAFRLGLEERKRLEAELEKLSRTDPMTGLANRRWLEEALSLEWRRAVRSQRPLSLVMADIDFFKRFNDLRGHLLGDDCLKAVAKAIACAARRAEDLAARYGGEEFLVVLPGTDYEQGMQLAEALRKDVENLGIPSPVGNCQVLTISCGLATTIPEMKAEGWKELLALADEALYEAKRSGRNRVAGRHLGGNGIVTRDLNNGDN